MEAMSKNLQYILKLNNKNQRQLGVIVNFRGFSQYIGLCSN